ncbi:endolytic transglycosylase MltG [Mycoplasma sp. P36-A1]|uniref:endolytic transglycosylase MltG n=1 Tax=Mycoplasma sp. P36-A1 TaxID=3252900 RepID=UPI003C2D1617
MSSRKLKVFLIFILVIVSAALTSVVLFVTPVDQEDKTTSNFSITTGQSTDEILNDLLEDNLIKNTLAAKLYIRISNNSDFKSGVFTLSKSLSMPEIIQKLNTQSMTEEVTVTFNEGIRVIDYASIAKKNLGIDEEEFKKACNDTTFINELKSKYQLIKDYKFNDKEIYQLEGLLAPNTYNFSVGSDAKTVIDRLVSQSNTVYLEEKAKIDKSQFNTNEIYTLASIVESEAKTYEDRQLVASIFANRLDKKITLGSDVTTYYGLQLNMSDRDLTEAELTQVNGYNTRADMLGLPIGPINSPSLEAIDAVLTYKANDYLYFVSDKNGKIYATKTLSEHENKIQELKDQGLWFTY